MNQSARTFIIILSLFLMSFTPSNESVVGTYSVSESNSSGISLTLSQDNSFRFINNSNKSAPLDITGKWTIKNNVVLLESDGHTNNFHRRWKIAKNGTRAKSRNGLYFMTLCKN